MPRDAYTVADHDPICINYLENLYSHDRRVRVRKVDAGSQEGFDDLEGRFDTVLCLNLLQGVEDDRLALRNLYRSLQPGGRACIVVPYGLWLYGSLDRQQGDLRRYTATDLRSKMEETGFHLEKELTFNRVSVPFWALHSRILGSRRFHRVQLKLFDSTIWLWRKLDRLFPWPGLFRLAVGKKPGEPVAIASQGRSSDQLRSGLAGD